MKQRLAYIDQLKGFSILAVVMGHVILFSFKSFKECEPSLTLSIISSFHMPMFAFLSGLMFTTICDFAQMTRKLVKQSRRLLLPFVSFLLIYAFTIRPEENMITHPFKLGLWYLMFLWQCYLLTHAYDVAILNFAARRNRKLSVLTDIVWLLGTCLVFKVAHSHLPQSINGALGIMHLYKLYPFFFVGCLIKRYALFAQIFGGRKILPEVSFILWVALLIVSLKAYTSLTIAIILGVLSVYPLGSWFYINSGGGEEK